MPDKRKKKFISKTCLRVKNPSELNGLETKVNDKIDQKFMYLQPVQNFNTSEIKKLKFKKIDMMQEQLRNNLSTMNKTEESTTSNYSKIGPQREYSPINLSNMHNMESFETDKNKSNLVSTNVELSKSTHK
jgi:hypothetical protein